MVFKESTLIEDAYMDNLDEIFGSNYGDLLRKGDPTAFHVGLQEFILEQRD